MYEELVGTGHIPPGELDSLVLVFDRPLEPCPGCGGLLSDSHLEAADAGWIDAACHSCGVVLAA